jgi:hypothetical protein
VTDHANSMGNKRPNKPSKKDLNKGPFIVMLGIEKPKRKKPKNLKNQKT